MKVLKTILRLLSVPLLGLLMISGVIQIGAIGKRLADMNSNSPSYSGIATELIFAVALTGACFYGLRKLLARKPESRDELKTTQS
jgi:hypothetical protein